MIITINDHPDMRRVFKELKRSTVSAHYSIGVKSSAAKELLLRSW